MNETTPDTPQIYAQLLAFQGIDLTLYGVWQIDSYGCLIILFPDCHIWIQARPTHCQRCNWVASASANPWSKFTISDGDFWPRPYFDLRVAIHELESWLLAFGKLKERTGTDVKAMLNKVRSRQAVGDLMDSQMFDTPMVRASDGDVYLDRNNPLEEKE